MKKIIFSSIILVLLLLMGSSFKSPNNKKTDYLITITTDYGIIKLMLFDDTPIHKANFLKLVKEGKYEGSTFHRIIDQFMIQGGEIPTDKRPQGWDTMGFISQTLPNEISTKHTHNRGALAAARTENPEKRSDRSQFYIVQNYYGTHHLDQLYTVFGQVLVGMEVVDKIAKAENVNSKPVKDIKMSIKADEVLRTDMIKFYGNIYDF